MQHFDEIAKQGKFFEACFSRASFSVEESSPLRTGTASEIYTSIRGNCRQHDESCYFTDSRAVKSLSALRLAHNILLHTCRVGEK